MNCKDEELNAKLYSNRATAHFNLGEEFSQFWQVNRLSRKNKSALSFIHQQRLFIFIDFRTGNFHESLSDAKTATDLQPSYVKAIVIGEGDKRKW